MNRVAPGLNSFSCDLLFNAVFLASISYACILSDQSHSSRSRAARFSFCWVLMSFKVEFNTFRISEISAISSMSSSSGPSRINSLSGRRLLRSIHSVATMMHVNVMRCACVHDYFQLIQKQNVIYIPIDSGICKTAKACIIRFLCSAKLLNSSI